MFSKIQHVGYRVQDLDSSVAWFAEKFGGQRVGGGPAQLGGRNAFVRFGQIEVELLEPLDHQELPPNTLLMHHVGYVVPDIREAAAELKKKGLRFTADEPAVNPLSHQVLWLDPDTTNDILIHLTQLPERPNTVGLGQGLEIDLIIHAGYIVDDLDEAIAWYVDKFGGEYIGGAKPFSHPFPSVIHPAHPNYPGGPAFADTGTDPPCSYQCHFPTRRLTATRHLHYAPQWFVGYTGSIGPTLWPRWNKHPNRREYMPKVIPVPDELSKPFWDAVNEKRLVLQNCSACHKLQYPPQPACQVCGSAEKLEWKEVEGKGHISTYIVIEDGRLNRRMPDQPYNLALITLDQDPTINFYSNLPGVPPYQVPVGASVEVMFEEVAPDQLIHEWKVVA